MHTILLTIIIFLVGITIWLWKSVNAETVDVELQSKLSPELFVEVLPPPLLNTVAPPRPRNRLVGSSKFVNSSKTVQVEYSGIAILPTKVYEGDSLNISMVLKPSKLINPHSEAISISDTKTGKEITLLISRESNKEQFLEIELIAAGFTVDGDKRQKQPLSATALTYYWNCYFPNSGIHAMTLILRVANLTSDVEIGIMPHKIKVVKIDHMTHRQVWILTSLVGILTGGLTLAEVLHRLGIW